MKKKQTLKYDYPIVVVKWKDAVFHDDDSKADEEFKPEIVVSVGWLIKDTEEYILICQDFGDDLWVRRRLTVPKEMIIEKILIL